MLCFEETNGGRKRRERWVEIRKWLSASCRYQSYSWLSWTTVKRNTTSYGLEASCESDTSSFCQKITEGYLSFLIPNSHSICANMVNFLVHTFLALRGAE